MIISSALVLVPKFTTVKKFRIEIMTTGFKKNISLNNFSINKIWINSSSYNKVEIVHFTLLAIIVDMIIGKTNYSA